MIDRARRLMERWGPRRANPDWPVPEAVLADLALSVPKVASPVAAYIPAVRSGTLVFTSGQLPIRDGKLLAAGRVGDGLGLAEGQACAQWCALNALAAIKAEIGDLGLVKRLVKVVVYVASDSFFTEQALVANGASELFGRVFGDAGQHVRSAVGVSALPLDAPVEVELVVEV